jgi:hypothetical protein
VKATQAEASPDFQTETLQKSGKRVREDVPGSITIIAKRPRSIPTPPRGTEFLDAETARQNRAKRPRRLPETERAE